MSATGSNGISASTSGGHRRLLVAGGVVLLVAVLALVLVFTLGGDDESPSAGEAAATTSTATTSAATTTAAAPATASSAAPTSSAAPATGATEGADDLPEALPEVALDAPAPVGNGVVATLPSIEAIQGTATGPGNINGPALRVTVRIQNGTADAVSLDGVATNLYHGTDRTPASPLDDPSRSPFAGTVAAGETAEAVYVFSVPEDVRDDVTVEVGYEAGAPLLQFRGPVS
jgi:pyruvate/2-oxoglutarate dehydrogenase complex dihydrolipoamide acyltransferase (E2) component